MVKASDNLYPKLLLEERLSDGSDTSTPAADHRALFMGEDGQLRQKDPAAAVSVIGPAFVGVRAIPNAVTALANTTWTSVAFAGTDRFDTDAFHDPASNNTRLTVPAGKAGKYLIGGNGEIANNTTGHRAMRILLNGTTRIADELRLTNTGSNSTRLILVSLYDLAVADYVELQLWQDSGGSVNTANAANSTCEFWMYRVG